MNLIQESYQRLFPEKEFSYQTELEYNLRLSDFNSNIHLYGNKISLHLNLQWKDIDDEIKIGLVQSLLLRILKKKVNTMNIELYNNFIRNIPLLTQKINFDPHLEESFQRVNGEFFNQELEKPNLSWGSASTRKLASYNFHNDTVTVSTIFKESNLEVLDYLMYHELLHKQQKYYHKNGRSFFHTGVFRTAENLYPNKNGIEREIQKIIRSSRGVKKKVRKSFLGWFWD